MTSLNNIDASAIQTAGRSTAERTAPRNQSGDAKPNPGRNPATDSVTLSKEARAAANPPNIDDLPADRAELVREVRAQIADDAYITDQRLDIALDRLINDALELD